jgi:hypothetical protein
MRVSEVSGNANRRGTPAKNRYSSARSDVSHGPAKAALTVSSTEMARLRQRLSDLPFKHSLFVLPEPLLRDFGEDVPERSVLIRLTQWPPP